MTIPLLGGASVPGPGLLLGTVSSASTTACSVTIDGAATAVPVIVPQQLRTLLLGAAAVGARVACVQVGGRLYATDVLNGGDHNSIYLAGNVNGPFLLVPFTVLATFTVPAGLLTGTVITTGYTTTGSQVSHNVLLDYPPGTSLGACIFNQSFPNGVRVTTSPLVFQVAVTAGTHTVGLYNGSGTSDGNDRASFIGWLAPT